MARSFEPPATKGRASPVTLIVGAAAFGLLVLTPPPRAHAAPAPEVEYVYDVVVRRHYGFPNNDALTYGHGICDKVGRGEAYGQVMGDVKSDVTPSDEFAANYLVSYAVNLLCPALIWQLRNSAAGYLPPGGAVAPGTYYSDAGAPKPGGCDGGPPAREVSRHWAIVTALPGANSSFSFPVLTAMVRP